MSAIPLPEARLRLTHLGTATVLLEIGDPPLRLLTDPALDAAGGRYSFGWGTSSVKTRGPALAADALGRIDAVLLTHDQHDDNLDRAGRELLGRVRRVVTTHAAARRLGATAVGLSVGESVSLGPVRVTATPARHGPPGSLPLVGPVIGFSLEWPGQSHGALLISGDTVWFGGLARLARRARVGTALLHLGGVGFPLTGPALYTMDPAGAVRFIQAFRPRLVVPIHYDGWSHFRIPREAFERAFEAGGVADVVRWVSPGEPVELVS